jgi:hypothetical protein
MNKFGMKNDECLLVNHGDGVQGFVKAIKGFMLH